jgi:AraC-like DNA-binding protein
MSLACRQLVEGDAAVRDIARSLGFPDPLHFARRFRQLVGEPPTAYRERYRLAPHSSI